MRLKGQAYIERLAAYSLSTLELISEIDSMNTESPYKVSDITTNPKLSEEEVVARLQELKKSYSMTKETK